MSVIISGTNGIQNVLGSASSPAESNTSSSNTGLYFPSSTTLGLSTAGTNALYINASQQVGINNTSPANALDVVGTGNFASASGANIFATYTSGAQLRLKADSNNVGVGSTNSNPLLFLIANADVGRIDTTGSLLIGTSSRGASNSNSFTFQPSSSDGYAVFNHINGTASGTAYLYFGYNGSAIASINQNGTTAVTYNTSSDYRLKTNIMPLTTNQSGPIIDALKPSQFIWKTDNSPDVGFIAHEMQTVIPKAVIGEKDAVDENGNPIYQQVAISTPEIIAYLVAELQSIRTRLASAETEITIFKAKVGA